MGLYNAVQKVDKNGEVYRGVAFNFPVINPGKRNKASMGQIRREKPVGVVKGSVDNKNRERAIRRAKTSIRDYIKTNIDLRYFVTYTLDAKKMDRYDSAAIYAEIRDWLANSVKRKNFKYVLVAEKHENGAWHFHGFTNIPLEWKYGFSTCSSIPSIGADRNRCINYLVSYVKKDMEKFNGRYYLHSNNLDKPDKIYSNVNFEKIDGYCMDLENVGAKVKIWEK